MLTKIFNGNRLGIILTYAILVLENGIYTFCPFFFGLAIDAFLLGSGSLYGWYIGVLVIGLIIGVVRRCWDTRVFGKVWKDTTVTAIFTLLDKGMEPSKVQTRANLAGRYVDFFEFSVPDFFRCVISIIISFVMICMLIHLKAIPIGILAIFALVSVTILAFKRKKWDHKLNDSCDLSNKSIHSGDYNQISQAYRERINSYIKMSDLEAASWGCADFAGVAAEIIVVIALVSGGCTTGQILAATAYVWMLFRPIGGLARFFTTLKGLEVANEKLNE